MLCQLIYQFNDCNISYKVSKTNTILPISYSNGYTYPPRRQFEMPTQFSLMGSLTVHKCQGGIFNHHYHKQQLVYVAPCRVTNLEGQFLANAIHVFTFCRVHGSTAPSKWGGGQDEYHGYQATN